VASTHIVQLAGAGFPFQVWDQDVAGGRGGAGGTRANRAGRAPARGAGANRAAGTTWSSATLPSMSDLLAARSQMAVSLMFHILFAIAGMAMPVLMVASEAWWRRTGDPVYLDLTRRWA